MWNNCVKIINKGAIISISTQGNTECTECQNKKCRFVTRKDAKNNRKGIFDILHNVNSLFKEKKYPGAAQSLVGSAKRNMVYIKSENDDQFDHDIQYMFFSIKNPIKNENYTIGLRKSFIEALKKSFPEDDFKWKAENSTRVITIKKSENEKLVASFDIALIDAVNNKIHVLDKQNNGDKEIWNELGNDVKKAYINAKNVNIDDLKQKYINLKCKHKTLSKNDEKYKSSSALFIEAVNNFYND